MVVMKEETRKGPWTEQEDLQLVCFVTLYGERRWDFIAKVSGLNRTGKSCRLRWVNYLHPGLKRGRMTPQEERLVLELHCRWGNRWSRIARRLPGRTDNEIKNYWRTHMRKKAQEKKMNSSSSSLSLSPSSTSSSSSSSSSSSCLLDDEPQQVAITVEKADESHGGSGDGGDLVTTTTDEGYPMDQIWKEIIGSSEARTGLTGHEELYKDEVCRLDCAPLPPPSPPWEYTSDSLWKTYDEEFKMCLPVGDFLVCNYHQQQGREYY